MKTIPIILLVLLLINQADAQNITFASRATLQVYVQKTDGQQVILTSNDMTNLYDQLHMTGELDLRTLLRTTQRSRPSWILCQQRSSIGHLTSRRGSSYSRTPSIIPLLLRSC